MKKTLTEIRIYKTEDKNYNFDALQIYLFDEDDLVLQGHFTRNHIDDMINGYKVALNQNNIPFNLKTIRVNDSNLYHHADIEELLYSSLNHPYAKVNLNDKGFG